MRVFQIWTICLAATVAGIAAEARGETALPRFANIFNDNMVLQRDKPVRIWGWTEPGRKVTVLLTEKEAEAAAHAGAEALKPAPAASAAKPKPESEPQYNVRVTYVEENAPPFKAVQKTAKADKDGFWQVEFAALPASFQPKFLTASGGGKGVALRNILVGEVWVTAGQSNMASTANKSKWLDTEGLLEAGVRYAHTGRVAHYKAQRDLAQRAEWKVCVGDATRSMSTIPYLFAKILHRQLKVPVGVINAASGGAAGNYWCSSEELHKIDFKAVKDMMATHDKAVARWEDQATRKKILEAYEKDYAQQVAEWQAAVKKAEAEKKRPPKKPQHKPPKGPKSGFLPAYLYNGRIVPIGRLAIRGALYLQGEQQYLWWQIDQYEYVFPRVISSFRTAFGKDKLPFGIITLQGNAHTKVTRTELDSVDRVCIIRDMHYRTHLKTANTGFICAHDVGLGLHPAWKRPLAERAVYWALRDVYKQMDSRRIFLDKVDFAGGKALVRLYSETRRQVRDRKTRKTNVVTQKKPVQLRVWSGNDTRPLGGFMIAGADQRWYPTKVRYSNESQALEVWSDLVAKPVAVRYGWGAYPHANLGDWWDPLPPFRTDDWPLVFGPGARHDPNVGLREEWYGHVAKQYRNQLDRQIRQASVDAAISEVKLHGNARGVLVSKADRMAAVLDELNPAFLRSDTLKWVDDVNWLNVRREDASLRKAAGVPDEMAKLLEDKDVAGSLKDLRAALARFRAAVEKTKSSSP